MLNKMSLLLAATAVALSAGAANADGYYRYHHHHHYGRSVLAFDIGSVAFGYNDGYWDTGRHWHRWGNQSDYQNYRAHGQNYHGWNHDRDSDKGWQRH